jgi:hypothetical protein
MVEALVMSHLDEMKQLAEGSSKGELHNEYDIVRGKGKGVWQSLTDRN